MTETPVLDFSLKSGSPQEGFSKIPQAQRQELPDLSLHQLLQRMPAFKEGTAEGQAALQQDFRVREGSQPAPRTGVTEQQPFPPADAPTNAKPRDIAQKAGSLQVTSITPKGKVDEAGRVSITFNQPMIAISSQEEASQNVPAKISPELKGSWRWLGTQTLMFQPEDTHVPKSTTYTVEVPQGTKAVSGQTLAQTASQTFSLPALKKAASYPRASSEVDLDPVMFVSFNQKVDAQKVLAGLEIGTNIESLSDVLSLLHRKTTTPKLRLATQKEIEGDSQISYLSKNARANTWVALKFKEPLVPSQSVKITLKSGSYSSEGPEPSQSLELIAFETYGPFTMEEYGWGWRHSLKEKPVPGQSWWAEFSNSVDATLCKPEMVEISPELPGKKVVVSGHRITISGLSKANTLYTVTFKTDLKDIFSQNLIRKESFKVRVGESEPRLETLGGDMVILDPAARPSYPVYVLNIPKVDLEVFAVTPEDYKAWRAYRHDIWKPTPPTPPGKKLFSGTISVDAPAEQLSEYKIDLSPYLKAAAAGAADQQVGQLFLKIKKPSEKDSHAHFIWVQATKLGVEAIVHDDGEITARVSDLAQGTPLAGAQVELICDEKANKSQGSILQGSSDKNGLSHLKSTNSVRMLIARRGADCTFMASDTTYGYLLKPDRSETVGSVLWCVTNDRGMYKPKEEVRFKGWVRTRSRGPKGDTEPLNGQGTLSWKAYDSRSNEIASGQLQVSPFGSFDFKFSLPDSVNLGRGRVALELSNAGGDKNTTPSGTPLVGSDSYTATFNVQEFRRPEFEVSSKVLNSEHILGETSQVQANASYYSGAPLPNAELTWKVKAESSSYCPPGWSEYTFGKWTPWWHCWFINSDDGDLDVPAQTLKVNTDSQGKDTLDLSFKRMREPKPFLLSVSADVQDVNRQVWSSSSSFLVHPSRYYVGLKSRKNYVEKGQPWLLDMIVSDLDGKAQDNCKVKVHLARLETVQEEGEFREKECDPKDYTFTSSTQPVTIKPEGQNPGRYRLKAQVADQEGRLNETSLDLWLTGGKQPTRQALEGENITLVPDKRVYNPGDEAKIFVQAPFADAQGLLTVSRDGRLETRPVSFKGMDGVITIPVKEEYVPGFSIRLDLDGQAARLNADGTESGAKRPAYASETLNISVSRDKRILSVEVEPAARQICPGEAASVNIVVKDSQGQPLPQAEVTLIGADEAILALGPHSYPTLINYFCRTMGNSPRAENSRSLVQLASLSDLLDMAENDMVVEDLNALECDAAPTAEGISMGHRPSPRLLMKSAMPRQVSASAPNATAGKPIAVRSNFDPLAIFKADMVTDANGRCRADFKVPDNLTRYRLVALVCDKAKQFGQGESSLTARLPLALRPSLPRFLNFGDACQLPVVVQNQSDAPMTVDLVARSANLKLLDLQGQPQPQIGFQVTIPANDRREVLFPAQADQAGTALFQVGASAGDFADAAEIKLPVYTPATSEAFATYGTIDKGAVLQKVKAPGDAWPQFGGLDITVSSTALQELTDAFIYLNDYPFDCSEQIASRLLATAALRDVLKEFKAKGMPQESELAASVKRDLDLLRPRQRSSGAVGLWKCNELEIPFVGLHVGHALAVMKAKGFDVPNDMLLRSKQYAQNIQRHIPSTYSTESRLFLRAYAVEVLRKMGSLNPQEAQDVYSAIGGTKGDLETLGLLWPTLSEGGNNAAKEIHTFISNRAVETAGAANFTSSYGGDDYLLYRSDRRLDAILLTGMMIEDGQNQLIPKLVRGLLNHRTRGRWGNTQENVFVLLALDQYFRKYENVTPDFVARVWLGDDYAGSLKFAGRETAYRQISAPMSHLLSANTAKGSDDLIIDKDGQGRLYYRLGLQYAPKSLQLAPAEYGFSVERSFQAVDNPDDVKRDADGTWHIKLGAKVRVAASMANQSRRYHVALTVPIPAGLEIINGNLAVSEKTDEAETATTVRNGRGFRPWFWWYPSHWYDHENLRDERGEAFSSLLWEGAHDYGFVCRATSPGTFITPPAKAEEMYSPETFGRSATDKVIVE